MRTQDLEYRIADKRFVGYLAEGSNGRKTAADGGHRILLRRHDSARARAQRRRGRLCVVGFHSGLETIAPQDAKSIRCKVMVCLGTDDPIIPVEQRSAFVDEMHTGGVDYQMLLYGNAGHSFTNREVDAMNVPGFKYDAETDRLSRPAMRNFFDDVIGPV